MKTNKSFAKRVKVTKNGKLKTLAKGRCHFNMRESNSAKMAKKKDGTINVKKKVLSRVLPKK